MKGKATKTRQQPARSCNTKHTLPGDYTPPLFRIPPELRIVIYELVATSTVTDMKSLKTKHCSTTLALVRVSQQLRLEAKPIWSHLLMTEVDRAGRESEELFSVGDPVRKRFMLRLWNVPGAYDDKVQMRLHYLMTAFQLVTKEMENWNQTLQAVCMELWGIMLE
ncbi:hypothetical protein LTR95_004343 [Oleoguttula sp. CCFEE 5521]